MTANVLGQAGRVDGVHDKKRTGSPALGPTDGIIKRLRLEAPSTTPTQYGNLVLPPLNGHNPDGDRLDLHTFDWPSLVGLENMSIGMGENGALAAQLPILDRSESATNGPCQNGNSTIGDFEGLGTWGWGSSLSWLETLSADDLMRNGTFSFDGHDSHVTSPSSPIHHSLPPLILPEQGRVSKGHCDHMQSANHAGLGDGRAETDQPGLATRSLTEPSSLFRPAGNGQHSDESHQRHATNTAHPPVVSVCPRDIELLPPLTLPAQKFETVPLDFKPIPGFCPKSSSPPAVPLDVACQSVSPPSLALSPMFSLMEPPNRQIGQPQTNHTPWIASIYAAANQARLTRPSMSHAQRMKLAFPQVPGSDGCHNGSVTSLTDPSTLAGTNSHSTSPQGGLRPALAKRPVPILSANSSPLLFKAEPPSWPTGQSSVSDGQGGSASPLTNFNERANNKSCTPKTPKKLVTKPKPKAPKPLLTGSRDSQSPGPERTVGTPGIGTAPMKEADMATGPHDAYQLQHIKDTLLPTLLRHPAAAAFSQPVDVVGLNIPHYHSVVASPMDLGTVASKLDQGLYHTPRQCLADIQRVFRNCRVFNPRGDAILVQCHQLELLFNTLLRHMPLRPDSGQVWNRLYCPHCNTLHCPESYKQHRALFYKERGYWDLEERG